MYRYMSMCATLWLYEMVCTLAGKGEERERGGVGEREEEKESERVCVCLCLRERESESSVCVCERERERERERDTQPCQPQYRGGTSSTHLQVRRMLSIFLMAVDIYQTYT